MGYSSIGVLYGVWLYWGVVLGIALLVGYMGYIMCALLFLQIEIVHNFQF